MPTKKEKTSKDNNKKYKCRKTLDELSENSLFNLKFKTEKSLKENFLRLYRFVEKVDGIILMLNNEAQFSRLDGIYNRIKRRAEEINDYLPDIMKIDCSEYDKKYLELTDKIESINKKYIETESSKIRNERFTEKLGSNNSQNNPRYYAQISVSSIRHSISEARS